MNFTKYISIRGFFGYFFIFLVSFSLFLSFQLANPKSFLCPDSFYHAKMASFLAQGKLIKDFVWLPYTILADFYSDHHFLYHLILVPFIKIFGNPFGLKIATLFFATLAIIIFYWFLKSLKIKFSFFWAFLLLTVSTFLTRINLAKVPSFALIILFLGLYFLFKRKYLWLAIISFIYVWSYNTWPILLVAVIIYCFSFALKKIIDHWKLSAKGGSASGGKIKNFLKYLFFKENVRLLFACLFSIILGSVINPYFPQNLSFNLVHIVKIGLKNYQNILPVGNEWYPYEVSSLVSGALMVFVFWFLAIGWFLVSFKKKKDNPYFGQSTKTLTFFILSFLFFIFTIKSRRNIEYFVPLAVFFSAFSFKNLFSKINWSGYFSSFKNWTKFPFNLITLIFAGLILIVLIFAGCYFLEKVWLAKRVEFSGGASFDQFKKVSEFLKEKTRPGEIIFHSSWDEFPILFFQNDQNYYINGLDPTFMYEKNKPLYWLWSNIVTGKQKKYLAETIKENFKADYVFVRADKKEMAENLEMDKNFEKIYQDEEASIFQIKK